MQAASLLRRLTVSALAGGSQHACIKAFVEDMHHCMCMRLYNIARDSASMRDSVAAFKSTAEVLWRYEEPDSLLLCRFYCSSALSFPHRRTMSLHLALRSLYALASIAHCDGTCDGERTEGIAAALLPLAPPQLPEFSSFHEFLRPLIQSLTLSLAFTTAAAVGCQCRQRLAQVLGGDVRWAGPSIMSGTLHVIAAQPSQKPGARCACMVSLKPDEVSHHSQGWGLRLSRVPGVGGPRLAVHVRGAKDASKVCLRLITGVLRIGEKRGAVSLFQMAAATWVHGEAGAPFPERAGLWLCHAEEGSHASIGAEPVSYLVDSSEGARRVSEGVDMRKGLLFFVLCENPSG